jgi:hypothetical protein
MIGWVNYWLEMRDSRNNFLSEHSNGRAHAVWMNAGK